MPGMAQEITVDLDDAVVQRLKERAVANDRSLEDELQDILTRAAGPETPAAKPDREELLRRVDEIHERLKNRPQTDSVLLLREDRDR
jgi:plasmid stability protein